MLCCRKAKGHLPHTVELGGANPTGAWGYIEAFQEMIDQVDNVAYH